MENFAPSLDPARSPSPANQKGIAHVFREIVESRRAMRAFTGEKVPDEVIREALRAATLAPNASNLQFWEFHWIRSPEKLAEMPRLCLKHPSCDGASAYIVCVARPGAWRERRNMMLEILKREKLNLPKPFDTYYPKIVPVAYTLGPFAIVGLVKRLLFAAIRLFVPFPNVPYTRKDLRAWAMKSTAFACQNLMLSLRAQGYDSCPTESFCPKRLPKFLGLAPDAAISLVITVGKASPKNEIYGPRIRYPESYVLREH